MYDFFHIKLNVKKNALFYFLFLLELILCFTLMLIGFDENKAYQQRLEIYKAETKRDLFTVTDPSLFLTNLPLHAHMDELNKMNLLYAHVFNEEYINSRGEVASFKIIEASESFFVEILKINPEKHLAYLSQDLSKKMKGNQGILTEDIKISQGLFTMGSKVFNLKTFVPGDNISTPAIPTNVFESGDIRMNDCMFLLMDAAVIKNVDQTLIKIKGSHDRILMEKDLSHLLKREVYITDLLADFEKGSSSQAAFIRLFGWISTVAISIIIFGASSMVLLFVGRRKAKNRIQHFYGASISRLRLQLFLEIFLVMSTAMILGQILALLLESVLSSPYYLITAKLSSLITLIAFCVCISLFITIFASNQSEWEK